MKFTIDQVEFEIKGLVDAQRNDKEVKRLTTTLQSLDKLYEIHEPLEVDVNTPNDKWSCHISEKYGITIEFSNDRLCFIAIKFSRDYLRNNPVLHISDEILNAIVLIKDGFIEYAFGSVRILSDDDLIPSKWSPILEALLIQLSLIN